MEFIFATNPVGSLSQLRVVMMGGVSGSEWYLSDVVAVRPEQWEAMLLQIKAFADDFTDDIIMHHRVPDEY